MPAGLVWGICNGFQILCEAHLLPGALTRNGSLEYRCEPTWLRVETVDSALHRGCALGSVLQIPVSHGEGRYVADEATLDLLEREDRVAFRYVARDGSAVGDASPNGSMHDIAGIVNERRNVLGMMPHPERACEDARLRGWDAAVRGAWRSRQLARVRCRWLRCRDRECSSRRQATPSWPRSR